MLWEDQIKELRKGEGIFSSTTRVANHCRLKDLILNRTTVLMDFTSEIGCNGNVYRYYFRLGGKTFDKKDNTLWWIRVTVQRNDFLKAKIW